MNQVSVVELDLAQSEEGSRVSLGRVLEALVAPQDLLLDLCSFLSLV